MPSRTFLGCDVGGTGSCAVLVTAEGKVLQYANGEASNPHIVGFERSARDIATLMQRVLHQDLPAPIAVTACISGGESTTLCDRYIAYFREALKLPTGTRIFVTHDVIAPLGLIMPSAVHNSREGPPPSVPSLAAIIAGTGSVAASFVAHREPTSKYGNERCFRGDAFSLELARKCGGWGPALGDAGSAYWISTRALTLALRIWDGMAEPIRRPAKAERRPGQEKSKWYGGQEAREFARSVLGAALKRYCQDSCHALVNDIDSGMASLVTFIYNEGTKRAQIASLASQLASLAAEGNGICIRVFQEAGEELGKLLLTALSLGSGGAHKIDCSSTKVCGVGGVFCAWEQVPEFADCFQNTIRPFLDRGGQMYLLRRAEGPRAVSQTGISAGGTSTAYGCARLGALACSDSNEYWRNQALQCLHELISDMQ